MNLTYKITLAIALTGITLAASAETVSRSVPLTTEVTRVYLTSSAELHLTQGDDEYIRLTAPEELLSQIKPRVKGRSLYLGRQNKSAGIGLDVANAPIRFDVQLKRIDAIRIWGSANVWLGDLQSDRLKLVLAGNSNVKAKSLKAWEMKLALAGSCDFESGRIETNEAKLKISGSGKINVAELQTSRMDISIAGSSDVTLGSVNAARLDTEIAGSANLNLKGKVDQQELSVAGSSDYKAGDLASNVAYIEVMGSGDVDVNVQKKLTAELSRGADLVYRGSPGLNTDISGDGKYRNAGTSHTGK